MENVLWIMLKTLIVLIAIAFQHVLKEFRKVNTLNMGMTHTLKLEVKISFSNYKNVDFILKASRSGFNTLVAAVITIPHQSEISHIEYPDYRKNKKLQFNVSENFHFSVGAIFVRCWRCCWISSWNQSCYNFRCV